VRTAQQHGTEERMAELLFIPHDTSDGRTGALNRALIGRHTLKHNRKLKYRTRSSGNATAQHLTVVARRKSLGGSKRRAGTCLRGFEAEAQSVVTGTSKQATDASTLHVGSVKSEGIVLAVAQIGPIICGRDEEDVQSIAQWYFLNQLHEAHASYFRHAQNHWTNGLWEMARANQPMFAGVVALASYREVALARGRSKSSYIELKGRVIAQIGKDLDKQHTRTDPLTLVAISLLAYLDIRDNHFDAARLHLIAFCNLVNLIELPAYAWLYCVWIDLRYALLTGQSPILPYHIPISFRRSHTCRIPVSPRTIQRASSNVFHCPQTEGFDHHNAFDLFKKLHALCLCSDQRGNSDSPPFGQVYDLEYVLRVIQSQVSKKVSHCHTAAAAELVILAAQLHVWMACRFWTPQRRESHLAFVSRASSILDTFGGTFVQWTDVANAESLLWILFTIVAMMRIYGDANLTCMLDLLHSTLTKLKILSHEDFSGRLSEWPWIGDWHPVQIMHVWIMLADRFDDLAVLVPYTYDVAVPIVSSKAPQRLFLGGLEFFNSL
jgi:hypothetical protein